MRTVAKEIEYELREAYRELEYRRTRHANCNGGVNGAMIKKLEALIPKLVTARLCGEHKWVGSPQYCEKCGYCPPFARRMHERATGIAYD